MKSIIKSSIIGATLIGATLATGTAMATFRAETHVGATSNYVWRGHSQTHEGPAVFGSIDFRHTSGVYFGAWTSNVSRYAYSVGDARQEAEVRGYVGLAGRLGRLNTDFGYIHYNRPRFTQSERHEVYGSVSFSVFGVGAAYNPVDENVYYSAALELELIDNINLGIMGGRVMHDVDTHHYDHVQVSLGKREFRLAVDHRVLSSSSLGPMVSVMWQRRL